jgi:hypothetical protein
MLCFGFFSLEAIRPSIESDGRHSTIDCQGDNSKRLLGLQRQVNGVDEPVEMVHVHRMAGVYDVGPLLNERTGKSQLIGRIVWGVGLALEESTHFDARIGCAINSNLAEYDVPATPTSAKSRFIVSTLPIQNSIRLAGAVLEKSASPEPGQPSPMQSISP